MVPTWKSMSKHTKKKICDMIYIIYQILFSVWDENYNSNVCAMKNLTVQWTCLAATWPLLYWYQEHVVVGDTVARSWAVVLATNLVFILLIEHLENHIVVPLDFINVLPNQCIFSFLSVLSIYSINPSHTHSLLPIACNNLHHTLRPM